MSVPANSLKVGYGACILAHTELKGNPPAGCTSHFEDDDAILGILIQTQHEPKNLNLFDEVLNDLNISTNSVHR